MKLKSSHDYLFFSLILTIFIISIFTLLYIYHAFTIPACFFATKFGIYCPACGATRAFISFINGNFMKSIYYNPIVLYCAVIIFIYLVLYILMKLKKFKEKYLYIYCKISLYIGIAILLLNFITRNILLWAFNIYL